MELLEAISARTFLIYTLHCVTHGNAMKWFKWVAALQFSEIVIIWFVDGLHHHHMRFLLSFYLCVFFFLQSIFLLSNTPMEADVRACDWKDHFQLVAAHFFVLQQVVLLYWCTIVQTYNVCVRAAGGWIRPQCATNGWGSYLFFPQRNIDRVCTLQWNIYTTIRMVAASGEARSS